jgi:predicted Zn-dependent protease
MKIRKLTAIFLLLLTFLAISGAAAQKSQLESMYDKGFQAFDSGKYDEALVVLDAIDARQPDLAESLNLRGAVYMRQGKYGEAEKTLRKALSIEPKFWNASYNLAEIPFLKKDWGEARNRFEALLANEPEGSQPETSQLIQYKILLTFILQGKENTVDWMLNRFELAKDSPALYYSNAAIAFRNGNEKEATEWLAAAKKKYPAPLNKLYAESLYEIGWMEKPAGESPAALEITSSEERSDRMKADAKANFEKAERAFQQRDFDGAAKLLDLAEEGNPNEPAFANLRGEILLEQGKFDEAEAAFRKVLAADPKSREAQYNLAQVPFKKGDYARARERFEALFAGTPGDEKNQAAQLIKYKIFMTLLLEGKDAEAERLMNQFKFTGDTPALYYAHAAWEYEHGYTEQGRDWVTSAERIYPPALNQIFATSFYDLSWLKKTGEGEPPPTSALAQADASPTKEPPPAMRLGQAEPIRAPIVSEQTAVAAGSPAATVAKATLAASPASSTALTAPVVATQASVAPVAATQKPAASPPTARLTPARVRASPPTFVEMIDRVPRVGAWLAGGVLLAGLFLLVWLVVQQGRRNLATVPVYHASAPFTAPRALDERSVPAGEPKPARELVATGPPKLSLDLRASESAVGAGVSPASVVLAPDAIPGVAELLTASPNEPKTPQPEAASAPLAEEEISAGAEALPPHDEEEVSLPAVAEEPALAKLAAGELEVAAPAPVVEERPVLTEPAFAEPVHAEKSLPELAEANGVPSGEPVWEPVGQGQPIPELTTALAAEPVISELTQPEPKTELALIEPAGPIVTPIAVRQAAQSSIEVPSFLSNVIFTDSSPPQCDTPTTTAGTGTAPAVHQFAPATLAQSTAGIGHTAVQLTFSLEIASMQLTSTMKMSRLYLKPVSKVVSLRFGSTQDPEPPMDFSIAFEMAKIDLSNGTIGSVRLVPSALRESAASARPYLPISSLEFLPGQGAAPVHLTPSHQRQASVQLTAEFRIAEVEFAPRFEIAAIVLNASSRKVSMRLPRSVDNKAVYEIENVQLGANDEMALIVVTPGRKDWEFTAAAESDERSATGM